MFILRPRLFLFLHALFFSYLAISFAFYSSQRASNEEKKLQSLSSSLVEKFDDLFYLSQQLLREISETKSNEEIQILLRHYADRRDSFITSIEWIHKNGQIFNRFGEVIGRANEENEFQKIGKFSIRLSENQGKQTLDIFSFHLKDKGVGGSLRISIEEQSLLRSLKGYSKENFARYQLSKLPIALPNFKGSLSFIFVRDSSVLTVPLKEYQILVNVVFDNREIVVDFFRDESKNLLFIYSLLVSFLIVYFQLEKKCLVKIKNQAKGIFEKTKKQNEVLKDENLNLENDLQNQHIHFERFRFSALEKLDLIHKIMQRLQNLFISLLENPNSGEFRDDCKNITSLQEFKKTQFYKKSEVFIDASVLEIKGVSLHQTLEKAIGILIAEGFTPQLIFKGKSKDSVIESDSLLLDLLFLNILRIAASDLSAQGLITVSFSVGKDRVCLDLSTNGFGYEGDTLEKTHSSSDMTVLTREMVLTLGAMLKMTIHINTIPYEGKKILLSIPRCFFKKNEREATTNVLHFKK